MNINKVSLIQSDSFDPYYNLALERALLDACEKDEMILYLWQNQRTVVIGRNQNYFKECQLDVLEGDGGHLARRLSGGGAVFHDNGNLNFTFIVSKPLYNIPKQMDVIIEAVSSLGIKAEKSGRNDATAGGCKFSGNAFYKTGDVWYHHGTILIDVDGANMKKYLTPSKLKLQSKGVDSVRARVINLKELNPDITVDAVKTALIEALPVVYGVEVDRKDIFGRIDKDALEKYREEFASDEWRLANQQPMEYECATKYDWGEVQVHIGVRKNVINDVRIYSDAMETDWCEEKANYYRDKLVGCEFKGVFLKNEYSEDILDDLDKYIEEITHDKV